MYLVKRLEYKEFAKAYFDNITKEGSNRIFNEDILFQVDKLVQSLTGCHNLHDLIDQIDNYQ